MEKTTMIELIKLIIHVYIYLFVISIFMAGIPLPYFLYFFTPVSCIAGIIVFVYLCRARQLVISWKIFFLLPHILMYFAPMITGGSDDSPFNKLYWSPPYIMAGVFYLIVTFGMPFLLYCFLQITDRVLSVIARIFCFILPPLFLLAMGMVQR
jgi:hypothetical protein